MRNIIHHYAKLVILVVVISKIFRFLFISLYIFFFCMITLIDIHEKEKEIYFYKYIQMSDKHICIQISIERKNHLIEIEAVGNILLV